MTPTAGAAPAGAPPVRLLAVNPTGLVSGAEIVLLRVLSAAAAAGWQVTCLCAPGPLVERLGGAGVVWERLPDLKLPAGRRPLAAGRMAVRAVLAARSVRRGAGDADVVLVNGFLALPALRLARPRSPVVWLVHDVVHRRSWARLLRAVRSSVGLAVAVSEAAAAPLRAAGLDVVVRRPGTPWPVAGIDRRPQPGVVGCAGLLTPWKGQDVLLDAFAALGHPDVVLELAGGRFPKDGPYAQRLRERASREDLDGRVRFLGHVDDPSARIRRWSVLVSPSVEPEAAGLTVLEAMSLGVPVVATDHGGPPEVLGGAGLLVPPGDAAALASAIGRLLDDGGLWESCHAAGPALVASGLGLADQQRGMLELLSAKAARS